MPPALVVRGLAILTLVASILYLLSCHQAAHPSIAWTQDRPASPQPLTIHHSAPDLTSVGPDVTDTSSSPDGHRPAMTTPSSLMWLEETSPVSLSPDAAASASPLPASALSAQDQPHKGPLRVAILDGHLHGHDEIIAPLLYTLSTIPDVEVAVFRNRFREGFRRFVEPWYNGRFYRFRDFFEGSDASPPFNARDADVVILSTADRDLGPLLDQTDGLREYPQLQIIAIAHRSTRYDVHLVPHDSTEPSDDYPLTRKTLERMAALQQEGRLQLITLAPNVRKSLLHTLRTGVMEGSAVPDVRVFVPIAPLKRTPDAHRIAGTVQKAVIQGTLVSWSRDYGRIFADLERRLHRIPSNWGYRRDETGQYIGSPDRRGEPFQLALVGHEDERETLRIPAELESLVERRADVPYPDYYREIGTADLLLPAFSSSAYLNTVASSSIPAAIMARVPVLASRAEVEAYDYLRGPAVVMRGDGEDEMVAIARLRKERQSVRASDAEWEAYEAWLLGRNRAVLLQLLGLSSSDADTQASALMQ